MVYIFFEGYIKVNFANFLEARIKDVCFEFDIFSEGDGSVVCAVEGGIQLAG